MAHADLLDAVCEFPAHPVQEEAEEFPVGGEAEDGYQSVQEFVVACGFGEIERAQPAVVPLFQEELGQVHRGPVTEVEGEEGTGAEADVCVAGLVGPAVAIAFEIMRGSHVEAVGDDAAAETADDLVVGEGVREARRKLLRRHAGEILRVQWHRRLRKRGHGEDGVVGVRQALGGKLDIGSARGGGVQAASESVEQPGAGVGGEESGSDDAEALSL